MKRQILIFITIFIIASALRFWQLGKVPVSMTDDEVRLAYSSYSIWNTGKDIQGKTFPLAFVVDGYAFNPVPIYLTSPFVGIFGLNMFTARLPFAITGVATVLILYFLTYQMFKNYIIAVFSSLALSFSVWHLQLSRFAYEGEFALFWYTLGIFIFLKIKRGQMIKTIFSMLIFFLAFHSYSGTKLIYLPLLFILIWYKWKEINSKLLITIIVFIFFTFTSFALLAKTQNAAQYGSFQFFFQDVESASKAVELERRASSAPEFLKRLYHNKLTYWSKIFIDRYQYAFSSQYLFTSQEASGIFSLWFRGQMYYIEIPLLVFGFLYLFVKKRREWLLLSLFLLIAPLPSGFGTDPISYTIRSSFMLPWLMIFVGVGIFSIQSFIKNKHVRIGIYCLILFAYVYFIGGYLTQYYFEWTRYGAKYYSKGMQDLVMLVLQEKNKKTNIIIADAGHNGVLHYALYSKLSPYLIHKIINKDPIKIDNIIFQQKCIDLEGKDLKNVLRINSLYIVRPNCHRMLKESYKIKTVDGKEDEWKVFEN